MSLNKLTSDTPINEWMHIGASTVKCNSLDTSAILIDGFTVQPELLEFSSNSSANPISSIYPTTTIVVSPLSLGIGSMNLPYAFEANKQLKVVTIGQISSGSATNVISYKILDNGVLVNSNNLSSTTWATWDSVRFENIYVFISPTVARSFCYYQKNNGQMICWSQGNVTFESTPTHPLDVALSATGSCDFAHYQTSVTYA